MEVNNFCKGGGTGRRTGLRSQPSKEDRGSSPLPCTSRKEEERAMDNEIPEVANNQTAEVMPNDSPLNDNSIDTSIKTEPAISPNEHLKFLSVSLSSHLLKVTVEIDDYLTNCITDQTIEIFKQRPFEGFEHNQVPHEYVKELYKNEILTKIKGYFFHHVVIDHVINEIITRKIPIVNYPRLNSIEITPGPKIHYHFDVSVADPIELMEWKNFAFKSPKRKKYKDLDKQVATFMESRATAPHRPNCSLVEDDDWVLFDAVLVDKEQKPLSPHFINSFWLKLGHDDVTNLFLHQLRGKELNSSFLTQDLAIHENEDRSNGCSYKFNITIKAIIKGCYFSLDTLKSTFKLKNKTEIHCKLMEVFSYRNDVSQRKSIIEEVFHLLLSKHRFEVPKHLILRRQEDIIQILAQQPDYNVYKTQKDFIPSIEVLAEKQLKEEIIIDQIAYSDNIKVDLKDISQYLHLLCNRRLKEFLYFRPIVERLDNTYYPINSAIMLQTVMREKTLNHIVHTLTH